MIHVTIWFRKQLLQGLNYGKYTVSCLEKQENTKSGNPQRVVVFCVEIGE